MNIQSSKWPFPKWQLRGQVMDKIIIYAARYAITDRLALFRRQLERGMLPEKWANVEIPAGLFLADICSVLLLSEAQKAQVLGKKGNQIREDLLSARIAVTMNKRQFMILEFVEKHECITNRDMQGLYPELCTETLRCDLAGLVRWGMLFKMGAKRGTYYTRTD